MADDTAEVDPDEKGNGKADKPEPPPHHEDTWSETTHTVTIGGEAVEYTARAGHLVLKDEEGKKQASFFSISYVRNDVENRRERPVVFAFNGGPGSSSVWLHLGAFGPRRVVLEADGMAVAPPGRLVDNDHSILDLADLVFIDPVSTGYSRAIPEDEAKTFHHFKKDVESVGGCGWHATTAGDHPSTSPASPTPRRDPPASPVTC